MLHSLLLFLFCYYCLSHSHMPGGLALKFYGLLLPGFKRLRGCCTGNGWLQWLGKCLQSCSSVQHMTVHLIDSSLSEQSDTVFMYGCHKIVHSFACHHLQRVEHSRAGAPKPRQPSYGGGYSDRNAYSYSDRDRGRSGRDRRCAPHTYSLSTSHDGPAIMMSPCSTVAPMLAIIFTAMSQTHATVACLLAWWVPSHGTTLQHVPEITRNAQVNPCDRVGDLGDIEGVHVSLQSPSPQEAQP